MSLENDFVKIYFEGDILVSIVKVTDADLEATIKIADYRMEVAKNKKHLLLSNVKTLKTISKDAREFLGSEKGSEGVLAAAILVNSQLGSVIANFFMKINRPAVPTKLFTEEEPAKKWLRAQLMKKED